MTVIATDKTRLSQLIKKEHWSEVAYCRELVTVNDTAGTLEIGQVLGQVTVGGKYKRAVETAADGSKVAAAIVMTATAIAGTTDTQVLVLKRGPASVSKAGLVLDATYDDATKKGVVYTSLQVLGIQVLEAA